MRGAFIDAGGDLPRLVAAAEKAGVTIEKLLVTHGHIDHCGGTGILAEQLGVPIEGPHEADRFWIARLDEDGRIAGAGLDVYESEPAPPAELLALDTVVLTPHVAGWSPQAVQASVDRFVENARRHFAGEAPVSPV